MTSRRAFLFGAAAALAAPAIVPASSLMKLWVPPVPALLPATTEFVTLPIAPVGTIFVVKSGLRVLVSAGAWLADPHIEGAYMRVA